MLLKNVARKILNQKGSHVFFFYGYGSHITLLQGMVFSSCSECMKFWSCLEN